MLHEGRIWIGTGENGPVYLLPSMANRHGLIAGATGTGKTVTLKVLAESFSDMGVPVFLSDIKSDLSGMVKPGDRTESIDKRLEKCGVPAEEFEMKSYPTAFWDVYGKMGTQIRATVESMGAQLMARMLGLNETQTGVLAILYRYVKEHQDEVGRLVTIADLKKQLIRMGNNTEVFTVEYGNVTAASVGAIQRSVAMLEEEGGDLFFGEPEMNVLDWLHLDENERGFINILSADELFNHPRMYSTFLLWLLTRLYEAMPEQGDSDKPRVVFFFDEAHLLFDNCSNTLMEKIEQVIRLIRSKGVGVYFVTQDPTDIPATVLGQLGNRVQHALRAYTPQDQKVVKTVAQTFRTNESFDTEEAITTLKTGQALISCLDESGAPGVVERATILPPQSHLGALTNEERDRAVKGLPLEDPDVTPAEGETPAETVTEIPVVPVAEPEAEAVPQTPSTPEPVQETTVQEEMSQTFKVFDPTTGTYVEKELEGMTQVADTAAASIQQTAQTVQTAAQTVVQPVVQAAQQVPVMAQQAVEQTAQAVQQAVPTIQVQAQTVAQPVVQQMAVMVQDPTTGQFVQQMMTMQQDPATGNWIPLQTVQAAQTTDPVALAEQQKAAAAAQKEAEKAAALAQKEAEKAAKEAAKAAKEQEAAERRARNDALREEAAERARRNDSVAGRVKNTAISTATRQVTTALTKGLTNAISDLFGGKKK